MNDTITQSFLDELEKIAYQPPNPLGSIAVPRQSAKEWKRQYGTLWKQMQWQKSGGNPGMFQSSAVNLQGSQAAANRVRRLKLNTQTKPFWGHVKD